MKNIEEANTNPFPKNLLLLKQSNTTTHFQKLFFSNNQTIRNNEINKPKTHLGFCSDRIRPGFCWSCWDWIGTVSKVLLELIGLDQWFSLTLSCSISLVPHRSSLRFCSNRIGPGFWWSWVLLEFVKGKNWSWILKFRWNRVQ